MKGTAPSFGLSSPFLCLLGTAIKRIDLSVYSTYRRTLYVKIRAGGMPPPQFFHRKTGAPTEDRARPGERDENPGLTPPQPSPPRPRLLPDPRLTIVRRELPSPGKPLLPPKVSPSSRAGRPLTRGGRGAGVTAGGGGGRGRSPGGSRRRRRGGGGARRQPSLKRWVPPQPPERSRCEATPAALPPAAATAAIPALSGPTGTGPNPSPA